MKYCVIPGLRTIPQVSVRMILVISAIKNLFKWFMDGTLVCLQSDYIVTKKKFITNTTHKFETLPNEFLELLKPICDPVESGD